MQKLNHVSNHTENALQLRQYRLIVYTTIELIALCTVIIFLYALSQIWYMVALISISCLLVLLNLCFLLRTKNINFCGHFITFITLLTIITANYLIGGMGTKYSVWFYVIPLIAASLLGWRGLYIYSILSLVMIVAFGTAHIHPFYHLPPHQVKIIEWTNHLIAFLVIVTTLHSLMRENKLYEQILNNKNHLLQVEKEKFKHLARFDQLTNLPNRQYFLQHLQEIIDALASNYCVTLFFMDLDNLKYINDTFSHQAGDALLRQTAQRLQLCFREVDFIARLAGDEFTAIVIHPQSEQIPGEIITRIIREFNKPLSYEEQEFSSSISVGLATYPNEAQSLNDLMNKADRAMYKAKKERKIT